ncbi:B3 domain-containing [Asimina triloba]
MGFRKAASSMAMQDTQASAVANGALSKETFYSGIENLPIISGYSGLLQSLKGSADTHLSALSDHLNSSEGDIGWFKTDKHGGRSNDGFLLPERKRTRNIGSKSKRLHIDTEDALELKLTWEEAQDLLRPPPTVKPSIVVIEDHEFEEYEHLFQCSLTLESVKDLLLEAIKIVENIGNSRKVMSCTKGDRISGVNVIIATSGADCRWKFFYPQDGHVLKIHGILEGNEIFVATPHVSSCAVPDEMNSKELENLLRMNRDFKKRKMAGNYKLTPEPEPSGLDALATAAVLGDDGNPGTPSIATTTKHPRHRPGCTCIVCIQPPSGKGPKHKPTCTCNVCMTVKRRFKTLMMRKKKRQSEREAETAQQKKPGWSKDELEVDSTLRRLLPREPTERDPMQSNDSEASGQAKILAEGKGNIDLNCHPDREDDPQSGPVRMSMMSLLQVASLPLETYLKQNGLTSLVCEQQASSSSHALPQATAGESEGRPPDDGYIASVVRERESAGDEGFSAATDQARNSHV